MSTWSLRLKLMTVIFGLSTISLALFGVMAYKSANALLNGKENLTRAAARGLIDKIDRNLFERYGDVQAYALSEPAVSGDPQRITAFINDMMPTYAPIYDLMIVTNNKGEVIAVNTVDKSGKPLNTSSLIGKSYAGEAWFKEAISGNIKPTTSFVEDLHVDADVARLVGTTGRVMNFTAPIRNKATGEITGVWTNRVSWADVVEAITKEETKELISEAIPQVFVYLTDAKGLFVLHPEGEKYELKESLPWVVGANQSVMKQRDVTISNFQGRVIEALSPSVGYSTYPGKGWRLVLQVPKKDPQTTFNVLLIGIAVSLLLAGSLAGLWLTRRIIRTLMEVDHRLGHEAAQVKETSVNISSSSQNLAQASTEQAAALQETAASIEEMSAMVKKNSENAHSSRQVATASYEVAGRGRAAVEQMVHAMEDINASNTDIMNQIEESNRQITDITKVITEIGNKTKIINEIVFQTKLLSFNASVEAARAGEHGKGFAVVAEEVGSLAQMSGNAAKEISDMLRGSIDKVESIVKDTRTKVERLISQSKAKTESGTLIARQCGQILEEVVRNVHEVNNMVSEISTATEEQAQGIAEISKAMSQLDQVTNEITSTSQESAGSSSQLAGQASSLFREVSVLKQTLLGSAREEIVERVPPPVRQLPIRPKDALPGFKRASGE